MGYCNTSGLLYSLINHCFSRSTSSFHKIDSFAGAGLASAPTTQLAASAQRETCCFLACYGPLSTGPVPVCLCMLSHTTGYVQQHAFRCPGVCCRYAMREALAIVAEEGLDTMWKRHTQLAKQLWQGLAELGLEPFVTAAEDRQALHEMHWGRDTASGRAS